MPKKKDFFESAKEVMSKSSVTRAKKKTNKLITKIKKPRKKKTYNLKSRITSALRRIWFYGPQRREAAKLAKERGTCDMCNEPNDKLQIDHIIPCVPIDGWDNWQAYIDRMFIDSNGLRGICAECHKAHTKVHAEIRKANKK